MRICMAAAMAVIAVFAGAMLADMETRFPLGMRYSVTADFARSGMPRDQIVERIGRLAGEHGTPVVLLASGADPLRDVDVIWFGVRPTAYVRTDGTIDWYATDRGGSLRDASQLGSATLSGVYATDDRSAAQDLAALAKDLGGGAKPVATLGAREFLGYLALGEAGSALWAMLLLALGLAWAWCGSRARARSLKIMNGVTPLAVQTEDTALLLRAGVPWGAAAWLACCAVTAVRHGTGHLAAFAALTGAAAGAFMVVVYGGAFLFARLMMPNARRVGSRALPTRMIRRGGGVFTAMALMTAIVILPGSAQAAEGARQSLASSARWREAADVVALETTGVGYVGLASGNAGAAMEYRMARAGKVADMLRQLDDAGKLGFMTTLGYSLVPVEEGTSSTPDLKQVRAAIAPFDAVVVVNPAMLGMLHVDRAGLRAQDWNALPDGLRGELTHVYAGEAEAGTFDVSRSCYRWDAAAGGGGFPVVSGSGDGAALLEALGSYGESTIVEPANPLIVLMDGPSRVFPAIELDAYTSQGAMLAGDLASAERAIADHGIADVVGIRGRVMDGLLREARRLQARLAMNVVAVGLALAAIAMCAALGANVWAGERAHEIFLRRTAGESYGRMALGRIARQMPMLAVVWVMVVLITLGVYRTPEPSEPSGGVNVWAVTAEATVAATLLYLACTAGFLRRAASRAFERVAHRQD